MPKTKTKPDTFREWLDDAGLTLEAFARSVPGLHLSTVAKWAGKTQRPEKINDAHKILIKQKYPTCPLVL